MRPKTHVTAVDLAEKLGLAPTTVSHVLAGRGDRLRIKAETQQRILQLAQEMGYRINTSARAMRTGRFGCATLVQPLRHHYLPWPLLVSLSRELEQRNMHLSMAHAGDEALTDSSYLPKVVRELAADGLFINHTERFPASFLEAVALHHLPCIRINIAEETDSVYPDDFLGGQMAAQYLLSLGHRRITFAIAAYYDFAEPEAADLSLYHYSVPARYSGGFTEMRKVGLTLEGFTMAEPDRDRDTSDHRVAKAVEYLKRPNRPTAIIAYEIQTALPFLIAAGRCGIRIPEDLSLIQFHGADNDAAGVNITTIRNNWERAAKEAVEMLCQKMACPDEAISSHVIPPTLVLGDTCAGVRE